jgi:hypothetical protein
MNALEIYLQESKADPVAIMNALQDIAAISDNCIELADVAAVDAAAAVNLLRCFEFLDL